MPAEWILAAVLGGVALAVSLLLAAQHRRATHGQVRRILVNGGYRPSEVHISAGEPALLIFRREETALCSERVVFPDLGISVMLPPFVDVTVDLPATAPGTHEFTCQMRMLHGMLIVDDPYAQPSRSRDSQVLFMPSSQRKRTLNSSETIRWTRRTTTRRTARRSPRLRGRTMSRSR